MRMFSVRLPEQLIRDLDKKCRKLKISRSELVRQLLETGLESASESPLTLHGLRSELLSEIQKLDENYRRNRRLADADKDIEQGQSTHPNETSSKATPEQIPLGTSENTKLKSSDLTKRRPSLRQRSENSQSANIADGTSERSEDIRGLRGGSNEAARSKIIDVHPIEFDEAVEGNRDPGPRAKSKTELPLVDGVAKQPPDDKEEHTNERRRRRFQDPLLGLAIGAERRQAVRLNRVLQFKNWSKSDLAKKLSKSEFDLDAALGGQKDLASLRVEALLATWESEMQETKFEVPIVKRK